MTKVLQVLQYMLKNDKDDQSVNNSKLLQVLQYMLKSDKGEENSNASKLLHVLQYMLNNDKDDQSDDDFNTISGNWKLICFKKNSPSHKNKDRQYDLYRLADENLMRQLKETLGIDYFALNYTVKDPTDLERYTGNVKPVLVDCNCQIMAFDEKHTPLPQFSGQSGITNVFLQKTNDKNTFNLISGSFPAIKEPSKTYSDEQFIKIIDDTLRNSDNSTKKLVNDCLIYYNKMLNIVYNDLKSTKNSANNNLADVVVEQFATNKNSKFTSTIKEVFNDLMSSTALPIISNLQHDVQSNQNNQNDQQLLTQFEQQFKQKLQTNKNYIDLKQKLQKL